MTRTEKRCFRKLKRNNPKYPDQEIHGFSISETAQDLINKLLEKDMTKRLGAKQDISEILAHPFFNDVDIDELLDKKVITKLNLLS